jgi:hypothetical protein
MTIAENSVMWHDDGHIIWLELNKSDLVVLGVNCPHKSDPDEACQADGYGCLVEWFIMRYGLECNVGVCEPSSEIAIAWSVVGNTHDLDLCQCWIIPITDDVFSMWATTQRKADTDNA